LSATDPEYFDRKLKGLNIVFQKDAIVETTRVILYSHALDSDHFLVASLKENAISPMKVFGMCNLHLYI